MGRCLIRSSLFIEHHQRLGYTLSFFQCQAQNQIFFRLVHFRVIEQVYCNRRKANVNVQLSQVGMGATILGEARKLHAPSLRNASSSPLKIILASLKKIKSYPQYKYVRVCTGVVRKEPSKNLVRAMRNRASLIKRPPTSVNTASSVPRRTAFAGTGGVSLENAVSVYHCLVVTLMNFPQFKWHRPLVV